MVILSRRRIPLPILIYEQFIHCTQIILRPIIQLLSTAQHAYQSFLVTSWFYSVYNIVTRWVILEKNININVNYYYPTTIWESIFAQMYKFLVENIFFQFLRIIFSRSKAKIVNNTRNKYILVKILPILLLDNCSSCLL